VTLRRPIIAFAIFVILVFGSMLVLVFTGFFDVPEDAGGTPRPYLPPGRAPASGPGPSKGPGPGAKTPSPPPSFPGADLDEGQKAERAENWKGALGWFWGKLVKDPADPQARLDVERVIKRFERNAPEGLEEKTLIPVSAVDMRDNPVVVRDGNPADPKSGLSYDIWIKDLRMAFVLIPAGSFTMGSPTTESGRGAEEEPAHDVRIRKPIYIGKYEVTQSQWSSVMDKSPVHFPGAHRPVESMRWSEAKDFVKRLNERFLARVMTCRFRLPSEAEWEYACRAGTGARYAFGDDGDRLRDFAWYKANTDDRHHRPVGGKKPNAWGLYDMHGNVWEWVEDVWHDDYRNAPSDGSPWVLGRGGRVMRGGSWDYEPPQCRCASRARGKSTYSSNNTGIRLVLTFGGWK
jgi:formylglycine-generating enzyme required for sulfatase activity